MFLLSLAYADTQCETYALSSVLGIFSTFDKAYDAFKTIMSKNNLNKVSEKQWNNGTYTAIFKHSSEEFHYTIQKIEPNTIVDLYI